MMSVQNELLLSDEYAEISSQIVSEHEEWFILAKAVNEMALVTLNRVQKNPLSRQGLLLLSLAFKSIISFESVCILLRYGSCLDSFSILRDMLEIWINMKAMASDIDYCDNYIALQNKRKLKHLIRLRNAKGEMYDKIRTDEANELIRSLGEIVNKDNPKKYTILEIAEKYGLVDYYNTFYIHASSFTHTDMESIKKFLRLENGVYWKFDINIMLKDVPMLLLTAIETITWIVDVICDHYEMSKEELEIIKREYKRKWLDDKGKKPTG